MPSPLSASIAALPPELRLLLTLSRTTLSERDQAQLQSLLTTPLRWPLVFEEALRHGVLPLVYHHLSRHCPEALPEPLLHSLRGAYLTLLQKSLKIRGECPSLLAAFEKAQVPALAFKGPVLGAMAYTPPSLRTFTDLDVFIRKEDVPRALRVLRRLGFSERNPLQSNYSDCWTHYLPYHAPHGNANGYVRRQPPDNPLHVDLHWGFASRYFLLPWAPTTVWNRAQHVKLDGDSSVPTFSADDTLLFLCIHATKDNFEKLRHVCDIAELLRSSPDLDLDRLLTTARSTRTNRILGLGLALAHDLLGAPLPPRLREQADGPAVRSLASQAVRLLFAPQNGVNGLLQRARFHLQVRDRWRDAHGILFFQTELSLRTFLSRQPLPSAGASPPPQ